MFLQSGTKMDGGAFGMVIVKNRKGRKRKSGRRTSSGALARQPGINFREMAALQPHRRELPVAVRLSEKAECSLGVLHLTNRISEQEYEAGRRFAVIVGAYRSAIEAPKGTAGGGKGYDCNGTNCDPDLCQCLARIERYRASTDTLIGAGQRSYNTTYRVSIHDYACAPEELIHLKAGLLALAKHYGLTNQRKAG